jgi:hypothetical protein
MGGFPRRGGTVSVAGHELVVEDIEGLRVSRLVLRRLATTEAVAAEGDPSEPPDNSP